MSRYVVLANVDGREFQNAQEFASLWGTVRNDIEELDGEIIDAQALLGGYDFLVTLEADSVQLAMEIALAIERHGLDTKTMQALSVDQLGEIVDDI